MLKKASYFSFLVSLFLTSCSNNDIKEEDFIPLYADIVIAVDTAKTMQAEEVKNKILSKYGYSSKQYDATIENYSRDPEKWGQFFDKVIRYVEEKQKKKKS